MTKLVSPIAHVPGVFSHYSPRTGSALVTKVYQHARALEAAGGRAYVLVNSAREAAYNAGDIVRFDSRRQGGKEWLTASERRIDAALGAVGLTRPMAARFYRPALSAVPRDSAAVVVYNQAAANRGLPRGFPGRRVLHLGNDIFGAWRSRDIAQALRSFDLVVAVSSFTAQRIMDRLPPGSPTIHVLRNGVDVEAFTPFIGGRDLDARPEILFVGNMVPHKGAHHLIRAATILAGRGVSFQVRVVGSWGLGAWDQITAYERSLRDLAEPLKDRVTFEPFTDRDRIPAVYRAATVLCMPVDWDEPAGQVVTEAMASGLAIVAARRGGIPEYLGPAGRYVRPADSEALADALQEILEDPGTAAEMGKKARERAEQMTWDVRSREFNEVLAAI